MQEMHTFVDKIQKTLRKIIEDQAKENGEAPPPRRGHGGIKIGQTPVMSSNLKFDLDDEVII